MNTTNSIMAIQASPDTLLKNMNGAQQDPFLDLKNALPVALVAVATFHLAYLYSTFSFLIAVYVFCLYRLTHMRTSRQAFYLGMSIGLAVYGPHLGFFWSIFGPGAIALWAVLAFWLALFLVLGRIALVRFGAIPFAIAAPFLWTGLEFFRSELYYLRFSWLNVGCAFSNSDELRYLALFGVYGIGFVITAAASFFYLLPRMVKKTRIVMTIFFGGVLLYPAFIPPKVATTGKVVHVAGVQLESPSDLEIKNALDELIKKYPQTEIAVLSEYTFPSPIPDAIRNWCKQNQKYLIAGGRDPIDAKDFYNTAFVVDPRGEIVFRQGKSVPIQFFKDGKPAPTQGVWNSPWGKLGLAICYDDSYTRVMDGLVRQGAQALIVPTMDVAEWGESQHLLHGRIIPMRAAEYRLPIFRLCSSGVSQFVDPDGIVKASAPFPGNRSMIEAAIDLPVRGRIPPDRFASKVSVVLTIALLSWLATGAFIRWRTGSLRSRSTSKNVK